MKKRKFNQFTPSSQRKKELNQSKNSSYIMNTQSSLSKIVKTEEDDIFKSNRDNHQINNKDIEDIEKRLKIDTIPSNRTKEAAFVCVRENAISNRDIVLPAKIIIPNQLEMINEAATIQSEIEKEIPQRKEAMPSVKKPLMSICRIILIVVGTASGSIIFSSLIFLVVRLLLN